MSSSSVGEAAPLLIEVRCNEGRMRAGNEAIPYSTAEIIDDAVSIAERGAQMFHYHVRDEVSGRAVHDTSLYGEVMTAVHAKTDLIVHPTTGFTYEPDPKERVRPVLELSAIPLSRPDMTTLAFGVTNVDNWDSASRSFTPGNLVYNNTRQALAYMLSALHGVSMPTISVCWELSHVRTAMRYRQAGLHEGHRLWQFAFTDNDLLAGPSPTVLSLQAMLQEIPPGEPWMVWCHGGDVLPIAAHAIAMGGHVGIGLGDYSYQRFGNTTNAELVAHVVAIARTIGRPIATSLQAREILGLPIGADG